MVLDMVSITVVAVCMALMIVVVVVIAGKFVVVGKISFTFVKVNMVILYLTRLERRENPTLALFADRLCLWYGDVGDRTLDLPPTGRTRYF